MRLRIKKRRARVIKDQKERGENFVTEGKAANVSAQDSLQPLPAFRCPYGARGVLVMTTPPVNWRAIFSCPFGTDGHGSTSVLR